MKKKITITACYILVLFYFLIANIIVNQSLADENANTLSVGTEEKYTTIQKAIDAAKNGDTIYVTSGMYIENLVIEKSITLIGENRTRTILQGGTTIDPVIQVIASDVKITDLQIQGEHINDNNRSSSAIFLRDSSDCNITNCDLVECQVALRISNSSDLFISFCNITNNDAGVFSFNSSNISIINTDIAATNFYGLSIINSSDVRISYCVICDSKGSGISLRNSQDNVITYNLIQNNSGYGVAIYKYFKTINESSIPVNISENPDDVNFSNMTQPVVINYPSLGNEIYQNNFIGNNMNAYDGYQNSWDNGVVGNYWDDYYGEDLDGDNIGDISYVFFGNQDYYPLMTPVEYEGTSSVTLPFVEIKTPVNGATVNGTITISGVSSNREGMIQEVLIKVTGESDWKQALGTTTWSYTWNTTSYENGPYTISARSTDGTRYSLLSKITLIVDNPTESEKTKGLTPGFEAFFVLISIFIIVFFLRVIYKKR